MYQNVRQQCIFQAHANSTYINLVIILYSRAVKSDRRKDISASYFQGFLFLAASPLLVFLLSIACLWQSCSFFHSHLSTSTARKIAILSQALSRMFWLRYSSFDLFQRQGYFLISSINCSRDITTTHNTQLTYLWTNATHNYFVLPAARDCMASTAHACPQLRFKI